MPEYPRIPAIVSVGEWFLDDEALPDTGFSGGVVVPARSSDHIANRPREGRLRLGNDRAVRAYWWNGEVAVGELSVPTTVWALGNDFILGREVLDQMEICFEFGERVRLRFDRE
jgi:hypothetical protein